MSNKKTSFISNINNKINNLSKIAILLIAVVYSVVLTAVVYFTEPNPNYIAVPTYEHVYYNETINPQISVIVNRTFDEEGEMTLKYNISVNIHGRISESSSSDPAYTIKNFRMSASLKDDFESSSVHKMYYFNEQKNYTTPITHAYTIDNSSEEQHPVAFYTTIQYKKNTLEGAASFYEKLMLNATEKDIQALNEYYTLNTNSDATSYNIYNKNSEKVANIQFIAKQSTTKENVYNCGVKISMENLNYESKHHIDMQTWIETSTGEMLPFIGAYGYSNQRSNYVQSGRELYKELKPKYICIKTVQYYGEGENDYIVDYFKQDITKLSEAFTSTPNAGDNIQPSENGNQVLYVAVGCGVAIVAMFVIVISVYVVKNKKEKEVIEQDEE